MNSTTAEPAGVVVPMWAVGAALSVLVAIGAWTASALLQLREDGVDLKSRIGHLEAIDATRSALPTQLATLQAKLDALGADLSSMREDLRALRTNAHK
jgi:outer membrane murein-binding lipoprotein Lpp